MTVRINKDAINLREKLSQLDKPSGLVGEELLRADTSADAREALNLEEHLFEDFESTGIDDNATSTKVTVSDSGVDVDGNLSLGDGDKATFGASDDLQIYHDPTTGSYISELGAGSLFIQTNNNGVVIEKSDGTDLAYFDALNSRVALYNGGATKFLTTSTGVDVTGAVTADGLTVSTAQGNISIPSTTSSLNFSRSGTNYIRATGNSGSFTFIAGANDFVTQRLKILNGGDVHLFENTGTTAKFVWDASAERLGIGTASPSASIHSYADSGNVFHQIQTASSGVAGLKLTSPAGTSTIYSGVGSAQGFQFYANGATEAARIDSSGNLLVGKTSATTYNITAGFEAQSDGLLTATRSSGTVQILNRQNSHGDITVFRKDGLTVGSIGSSPLTTQTYFAGTTRGVTFGSSTLYPCNNAGSGQDAQLDIGSGVYRFKDLYLSGGVITSSDYRLKEDVQPMQSYADTIKQMNLVNFAWKDSGEREDGFIAHELQALVPSAVRGDKDAIDEDGNEQYQGVDPLKLIPVLTKALQEALERIEILENK